MLALPPPSPFFFLPAACTPKVANVPVKTEAMKVGSSFCSGILNAAGNLTYAKVKIPGYDAGEKIDPTFIASVFTGTLATFGVQTGGKKKKGDSEPGSANISKKDMEFLIAKASETAPAQTIRIESGPVKIVPDTK